ncbi:hypothetical protein [Bacillus toyonensis]|uniref:hypothetical protein n=1 Tax=Bacillus toyonensis TaxID=155322 RepID=UPI000BFBCA15|nr:hypothetical protein [Bacillus toyonensis]PHC48202.1 hypothetical protein COF08_23460 [Bacillus toyonensis]
MSSNSTGINYERVLYSYESMKTTLGLLSIKNDSFFKRAIARLIIMRAEDFIKFAKRYNNNLKRDGLRNREEHEKTKGDLIAFEQLYNEYIVSLRHKLSGHFQDVCFFERIELWNEIKVDIIEFLVELAKEIMSQLNPGINIECRIDREDLEIFQEVSEKYSCNETARISFDALALTRENTMSALFGNELHSKPAAISTLCTILQYEIELLKNIKQKELINLIKTLVVVDIISLVDNIITRELPDGAKQEMNALDIILEKNDLIDAAQYLKVFKEKSNIMDMIFEMRSIRNVACAHIDEQKSITEIRTLLNELNHKNIYICFDLIQCVLKKIYKMDIRLNMFLIKSQPVYGVYAVRQPFVDNYENIEVDPLPIPERPIYTSDKLEKSWENIIKGVDVNIQLQFFIDGLLYSNEIKERLLYRYIPLEPWVKKGFKFNVVHKFIEEKLEKQFNNPEPLRVLETILNYRNHGKSHILCAILLKNHKNIVNMECKKIILRILGLLSDADEIRVIKLLQQELSSSYDEIKFISLISLLRIDTECNGVAVANKEKVGCINIGEYLINIIGQMPIIQRVKYVLSTLSHLQFDKKCNYNKEYNKKYYCSVLKELFDKDMNKLLPSIGCSKDDLLSIIELVLGKNNISLATLRIGDMLCEKDENEADNFYRLIAYEKIKINSSIPQLVYYKAIAMFRLGKFDIAADLALFICEQEPLNKQYRYFALNALATTSDKDRYYEYKMKIVKEIKLESKDFRIIDEIECKFNIK